MNKVDGVGFSECYEARVESEMDGVRVPVISRSDLVQNKKASARPKNLGDLDALE